MYTKATFAKITFFQAATHGWYWGNRRDIYGALRYANK